jgi:hypothetical protein
MHEIEINQPESTSRGIGPTCGGQSAAGKPFRLHLTLLLALGGNFGWGAELRVREEELCTLPPEGFQRSAAVSPDF